MIDPARPNHPDRLPPPGAVPPYPLPPMAADPAIGRYDAAGPPHPDEELGEFTRPGPGAAAPLPATAPEPAPRPADEPVVGPPQVTRAVPMTDPDPRRPIRANVDRTDNHENGVQLRPIDDLEDTLVTGTSYLRRPAFAYFNLSGELNAKIATANNSGMNDELREGMVQDVAIRNRLGPRIVSETTYTEQAELEQTTIPQRNEALRPYGLTMEGLAEEAAARSTTEIVDDLMRKLEAHTDFLEHGRPPTNWPEAATAQFGLTSANIFEKVHRTSELVALSLEHLGDQMGDAGQAIADRLEAWRERTFNLHLDHGQVGLAMPIANTATGDRAVAMTDRLTRAMPAVRAERGDQGYRSLYHYASQTLSGEVLNQFLRQTPRLELQLTPGAERINYPHTRGIDILERYPESRPVHARLINGQITELPYEVHRSRTLTGFGTAIERESFGYMDTVDHTRLDQAAKDALALAIGRGEEDTVDLETPSPYRRLALTAGGTLYTVTANPSEMRSTRNQEDLESIEPLLDNPVTSLEPIADGYMVVPNRGGTLNDLPYLENEAILVGAGGQTARHYWISGRPRFVLDRYGDGRIMRESMDLLQPRWIVMPVRFFRVEELRHDET